MLRTLMVAVLLLAASEAAAQHTSFLLINGMAYPISQLSVSESDFNFWTPNVLHPPPIKALAPLRPVRAGLKSFLTTDSPGPAKKPKVRP